MTEEKFDFEPEIESKPKKSKDFWLFLIFIDIIALVFCGFLVYQSLSQKFAPPAPSKDNVPVKESPAKPPKELTPEPKPITQPAPIAQAKPVSMADAAAEADAPAPVITPAKPAAAQPPKAEKKQSVIIALTGGKTRKATFKYFDDAKTVSIVSGFTMTKPMALKKSDGVWQGTFSIYPGEYKYMFIVDGKQTLDPHAQEKDGRSVVTIK